MYTETELFAEVQTVIEEFLDGSRPAPANWIAHAVLKRHPGLEGDDKEFYTLCAAKHVREAVQRALRRFKAGPEDGPDPQLVLPGFKYLQRAYLVTRDGEQTLVRIEQMTATEREAKAAEYERMAKGCETHAEELRRYGVRRGEAA